MGFTVATSDNVVRIEDEEVPKGMALLQEIRASTGFVHTGAFFAFGRVLTGLRPVDLRHVRHA